MSPFLRLITFIAALIFIFTFPLWVLWSTPAVSVTYSLASLPVDFLPQAQTTLINLGRLGPDSGFTLNEIQHLNDARRLASLAKIFGLMSLLTLILILIFSRKLYLHQLILSFRFAALSGLILIISLPVILIFTWDSAFTLFHQVLFPQGNWAFPADSFLITLYPEIFWQTIFGLYLAIVLLLTLPFVLLTLPLKSHPLQTQNPAPL